MTAETEFDLKPMEARSVEELPSAEGWQYEPKWDGFPCLAFKIGGEIELKAKSGKSLMQAMPINEAACGLVEPPL
jgi:ATP-dependent DNA ligase